MSKLVNLTVYYNVWVLLKHFLPCHFYLTPQMYVFLSEVVVPVNTPTLLFLFSLEVIVIVWLLVGLKHRTHCSWAERFIKVARVSNMRRNPTRFAKNGEAKA